MNETIEIINKYGIGTILKKLNIKLMYGERFAANTTEGIIYIPKTISLYELEVFKRVASSVNRLHRTELNENNIEEMCVFVILHEIGHIVDYRKHKHIAAYQIYYTILVRRAERKLRRVRAAFRIIGKIIGECVDKAYEGAIIKHNDRYRCIPHEEKADKFAIRNVYEVLQGTGKIYC